MKFPALLPLCILGTAQALAVSNKDQVVLSDPSPATDAVGSDRYLIELAPGETRWVKGKLFVGIAIL